jgi:hypothetical protein
MATVVFGVLAAGLFTAVAAGAFMLLSEPVTEVTAWVLRRREDKREKETA